MRRRGETNTAVVSDSNASGVRVTVMVSASI
jgi:hypothetical protein